MYYRDIMGIQEVFKRFLNIKLPTNQALNHHIEIEHNGVICRNGLPDDIAEMNIVDEIKKVPGLQYKRKKTTDGYSDRYYVVVSNQVGEIIELYLELEGYADIELSKFLMDIIGHNEEVAPEV